MRLKRSEKKLTKPQEYSHLFESLRRQVYGLMISIFLLLFLLFFIFNLNAKSQRDSAILVDMLGRQRMYTQKMSKEVVQIAYSYQLISDHLSQKEGDAARENLPMLKSNLNNSQMNFEKILKQTLTGTLSTVDGELSFDIISGSEFHQKLLTLSTNWSNYNKSIDIIMTQSSDSAIFKNAVLNINKSDAVLLNNCESINELIRIDISKEFNRFKIGAIILISILLILTLYTLYRLYHFLFLPLRELYTGFSQMGLNGKANVADEHGLNQVLLEVRSFFAAMKEIMRLMGEISASSSFDESLKNIFESFKPYMPYSYIGIALFKNGNPNKLIASYGVAGQVHNNLANQLLGLEVNVKETSLGRILESGIPRVINDYENYFENRVINSYSAILLENGIKSSITLPLKMNQKNIGFIFFSSNLKDIYKMKHVKFLEMVGKAITVSFEKNIFVDDLLYSSVLALAKLAEARDEDTGMHLTRMKNYSMLLTKLMKDHPDFKNQIDSQFLVDIEKFSPMHDIGKVGVSDTILLKPGKLTFEEFEEMKHHTIFGANVLREAEENLNQNSRSLFRMGIDIAQSHHEKWDGSGYPEGLVAAQIPLAARIVALADVLDALLSKRPYKQPFTFEDSLEIIKSGRGQHFDPMIVDVLLNNVEAFKKIHFKSVAKIE